MQALRNRVESLRNYVAYPLLGMQRVKQDGWGRRRHWRSRNFCRLLGRDAHKSFRKNSDSPPSTDIKMRNCIHLTTQLHNNCTLNCMTCAPLRLGVQARLVSNASCYSYEFTGKFRPIAGCKAGISKEIRDKLQNHSLQDVSNLYYDRYDYFKEKRIAMNIWNDYLLKIIRN